jgi:DNA-binding XRE family transcriptional regulator
MSDPVPQAVRNRIRQLRIAAGWSQQELAQRVETTRQTINAIELQKYLPSLELAFRLARVFSSDVDRIFQDPQRLETDIVALLTYVPAKDFALSRAFYADLGFAESYCGDDAIEMTRESQRFILRNHYSAEFAANATMQLEVRNLDAWWQRLLSLELPSRFPGIMLRAPSKQVDGTRALALSDPSGVLWTIVESRCD